MIHKYIIPMTINEAVPRSDYDRLIRLLQEFLPAHRGQLRLRHLLPLPSMDKAFRQGLNIEVGFPSPGTLRAFLRSHDFHQVKASVPSRIIGQAYVVNEDRFDHSCVMLHNAG
jgi:hypothetical protein